MSEDTNNDINNKKWTEAERLELASKLDKELEDYIDNLDRKSYMEGWPEDRWQEEMEKHPFFMTKLPDNPDEVSPLIAGLQELKYSEEYNTPNELAQSYKEDGNFNYKHKKYRLAILSFSKAISSKCDNNDLMAQLYNNRALAQMKLENYRSALNDANQALKLKSDYEKPQHTAAKCYLHVKDYDKCINICDQILDKSENKDTNKEIATLRAKAVNNKKLIARDSRIQDLKEKKRDQIRDKIVCAIKSRNIKIDDSDLFYDSQCHVYLNEEDRLIWPVVFTYPENSQSDFIQNFHECTTIEEQMEVMFAEQPAWDTEKRYQLGNLSIYFIGIDMKPYKVDIKKSLGEILQHQQLLVKGGTPSFSVLIAKSMEETVFLKSYGYLHYRN